MRKIADISENQGTINWEEAREELDFVIFRASIGLDFDKKYMENTSLCNLPFAAYHYIKAKDCAQAIAEAQFFVQCANSSFKKPYIYFIDVESKNLNDSNTQIVCETFIRSLYQLGCEKVGMYINTLYPYAGNAVKMVDVMWIPRWGKDDGNIPEDKYAPKYKYDIWQYTSKGKINGIKGNVDLDILRPDLSWEGLLGLKKGKLISLINSVLSLIKHLTFFKK